MVGVMTEVSKLTKSLSINCSILSELTFSRLYLVMRVIWKERAAILSFSLSSPSSSSASM